MSKNNFFFKSLGLEEKKEILTEITRSDVEILMWKKGSKNMEKFRALKFNVLNFSLILDIVEYHTRYLDDDVLITFTSNHLQYFSTCTLRLSKDKNYYVDMSGEIYKCEQRRSYRLNSSSITNILLTIGNKSIKCLNISVGGISFLIDNADIEKYKKGTLYKDTFIEINGISYKIPLFEVINVNSVVGRPTFKIGARFVKLNSETESQLCRQINNEIFLLKKALINN